MARKPTPTASSRRPTLEEGLAESAERSGAIGNGATDDTPKIYGMTLQNTERRLAVGDTVILHTNTPINGQQDNLAEVTKLNANNSTVNVKVLNNGTGKFDQVDSVKNYIPQDRSPWWSWPEEQPEAVEETKAAGEKDAA